MGHFSNNDRDSTNYDMDIILGSNWEFSLSANLGYDCSSRDESMNLCQWDMERYNK